MNEAVDEQLTALLDGELAEAERSALFHRLAADPALQARFERLAGARGSLDAVFAGMLSDAPLARLRASLPAKPAPRRSAWSVRVGLAAGFALAALIGAALAAWVTLGMRGEEDWSNAVVEYMQLYTPETFAGLKPDEAQEASLVAAVGKRIGVPLTAQSLGEPGLAFKTAFILNYDGAPLGEFVFTDGAGAPHLFCVLAAGAAPTPLRVEKRDGYTVATWARDGKQFLVIGPSPKLVDDWAHALAARA